MTSGPRMFDWGNHHPFPFVTPHSLPNPTPKLSETLYQNLNFKKRKGAFCCKFVSIKKKKQGHHCFNQNHQHHHYPTPPTTLPTTTFADSMQFFRCQSLLLSFCNMNAFSVLFVFFPIKQFFPSYYFTL